MPCAAAAGFAPLVAGDRQVVCSEPLRQLRGLPLREAATRLGRVHDAADEARGEAVGQVPPHDAADGRAAVAGGSKFPRPVVDAERAPSHRQPRRGAARPAVEAADDVMRQVQHRRAAVACSHPHP